KGERCDPEVVLRDVDTFFPEGEENGGVVGGGLEIGTQDRDVRLLEEFLELDLVFRKAAARTESRLELGDQHQRHIDPRRFTDSALQSEISDHTRVGVGVQMKRRIHSRSFGSTLSCSFIASSNGGSSTQVPMNFSKPLVLGCFPVQDV